jgi:hypothetical protein
MKWLYVTASALPLLLPVLGNAQQSQSVSVGSGNKKVNIATGNARISNTTINRKTVNIYNIYYGDPLTDTDKEKLATKKNTSIASRTGNPSVLIIPKISGNTDIYAALNDPQFRQGLTIIRQAFLDEGYQVLPYPEEQEVKKSGLSGRNAHSKSQGIFLSGADICIEVDMIRNHENDENSVTVIMSAFSRESGELIAEKSATSNAFRTTDYGLLLQNVVPDVTQVITEAIKAAIKQ